MPLFVILFFLGIIVLSLHCSSESRAPLNLDVSGLFPAAGRATEAGIQGALRSLGETDLQSKCFSEIFFFLCPSEKIIWWCLPVCLITASLNLVLTAVNINAESG